MDIYNKLGAMFGKKIVVCLIILIRYGLPFIPCFLMISTPVLSGFFAVMGVIVLPMYNSLWVTEMKQVEKDLK